MPRSKRLYKTNTHYHLYNRGNRKQIVFYSSKDYQRFLDYLKYYSNKYNIEIGAYCLMPNHFHLAVRSLQKGEDISKMMQSFMTKYCIYVNLKYQMVGRTFQGTYKHKELEDIYDYNRLMKYFRNNPVEAGMVKDGEFYRWLKT
ncbi:MAG: transposase [Candidatus Dojkabacteria bacterium]|nr:transposase [Candidatus Dojkabacteria bacterium]